MLRLKINQTGNGVSGVRIWTRLLGLSGAVVERVVFDECAGLVVAHVRPIARQRGRCGICRRRCRGYDAGRRRRRWRDLDAGTCRVMLEAAAPRVRCRVHGVVVAAVPWAAHGAGHTRRFDQQVAWAATECSKTAVAALMRVSWRTVGAIITRFRAAAEAGVDRLERLRRIGIDEISYRKGQKYLTVVVCHDTRRVVWMGEGRGRPVLRRFFDQLGAERAAAITHVSADAADWIAAVVADRAPQAVLCLDAFHVVAWATGALDEERRAAWNTARRAAGGSTRHVKGPGRAVNRAVGPARVLKRARWALWKNPEDLTAGQQAKLAFIAKAQPRLHRAYLLKEGLRTIFALRGADAATALDRWIGWSRRCRIPVFVQLGQRINAHRHAILATLTHGLSNGLVESTNTKTRLIIRRGFGFGSAHAIIALVMLSLGGNRPRLPDRS